MRGIYNVSSGVNNNVFGVVQGCGCNRTLCNANGCEGFYYVKGLLNHESEIQVFFDGTVHTPYDV